MSSNSDSSNDSESKFNSKPDNKTKKESKLKNTENKSKKTAETNAVKKSLEEKITEALKSVSPDKRQKQQSLTIKVVPLNATASKDNASYYKITTHVVDNSILRTIVKPIQNTHAQQASEESRASAKKHFITCSSQTRLLLGALTPAYRPHLNATKHSPMLRKISSQKELKQTTKYIKTSQSAVGVSQSVSTTPFTKEIFGAVTPSNKAEKTQEPSIIKKKDQQQKKIVPEFAEHKAPEIKMESQENNSSMYPESPYRPKLYRKQHKRSMVMKLRNEKDLKIKEKLLKLLLHLRNTAEETENVIKTFCQQDDIKHLQEFVNTQLNKSTNPNDYQYAFKKSIESLENKSAARISAEAKKSRESKEHQQTMNTKETVKQKNLNAQSQNFIRGQKELSEQSKPHKITSTDSKKSVLKAARQSLPYKAQRPIKLILRKVEKRKRASKMWNNNYYDNLTDASETTPAKQKEKGMQKPKAVFTPEKKDVLNNTKIESFNKISAEKIDNEAYEINPTEQIQAIKNAAHSSTWKQKPQEDKAKLTPTKFKISEKETISSYSKRFNQGTNSAEQTSLVPPKTSVEEPSAVGRQGTKFDKNKDQNDREEAKNTTIVKNQEEIKLNEEVSKPMGALQKVAAVKRERLRLSRRIRQKGKTVSYCKPPTNLHKLPLMAAVKKQEVTKSNRSAEPTNNKLNETKVAESLVNDSVNKSKPTETEKEPKNQSMSQKYEQPFSSKESNADTSKPEKEATELLKSKNTDTAKTSTKSESSKDSPSKNEDLNSKQEEKNAVMSKNDAINEKIRNRAAAKAELKEIELQRKQELQALKEKLTKPKSTTPKSDTYYEYLLTKIKEISRRGHKTENTKTSKIPRKKSKNPTGNKKENGNSTKFKAAAREKLQKPNSKVLSPEKINKCFKCCASSSDKSKCCSRPELVPLPKYGCQHSCKTFQGLNSVMKMKTDGSFCKKLQQQKQVFKATPLKKTHDSKPFLNEVKFSPNLKPLAKKDVENVNQKLNEKTSCGENKVAEVKHTGEQITTESEKKTTTKTPEPSNIMQTRQKLLLQQQESLRTAEKWLKNTSKQTNEQVNDLPHPQPQKEILETSEKQLKSTPKHINEQVNNLPQKERLDTSEKHLKNTSKHINEQFKDLPEKENLEASAKQLKITPKHTNEKVNALPQESLEASEKQLKSTPKHTNEQVNALPQKESLEASEKQLKSIPRHTNEQVNALPQESLEASEKQLKSTPRHTNEQVNALPQKESLEASEKQLKGTPRHTNEQVNALPQKESLEASEKQLKSTTKHTNEQVNPLPQKESLEASEKQLKSTPKHTNEQVNALSQKESLEASEKKLKSTTKHTNEQVNALPQKESLEASEKQLKSTPKYTNERVNSLPLKETSEASEKQLKSTPKQINEQINVLPQKEILESEKQLKSTPKQINEQVNALPHKETLQAPEKQLKNTVKHTNEQVNALPQKETLETSRKQLKSTAKLANEQINNDLPNSHPQKECLEATEKHLKSRSKTTNEQVYGLPHSRPQKEILETSENQLKNTSKHTNETVSALPHPKPQMSLEASKKQVNEKVNDLPHSQAQRKCLEASEKQLKSTPKYTNEKVNDLLHSRPQRKCLEASEKQPKSTPEHTNEKVNDLPHSRPQRKCLEASEKQPKSTPEHTNEKVNDLLHSRPQRKCLEASEKQPKSTPEHTNEKVNDLPHSRPQRKCLEVSAKQLKSTPKITNERVNVLPHLRPQRNNLQASEKQLKSTPKQINERVKELYSFTATSSENEVAPTQKHYNPKQSVKEITILKCSLCAGMKHKWQLQNKLRRMKEASKQHKAEELKARQAIKKTLLTNMNKAFKIKKLREGFRNYVQWSILKKGIQNSIHGRQLLNAVKQSLSSLGAGVKGSVNLKELQLAFKEGLKHKELFFVLRESINMSLFLRSLTNATKEYTKLKYNTFKKIQEESSKKNGGNNNGGIGINATKPSSVEGTNNSKQKGNVKHQAVALKKPQMLHNLNNGISKHITSQSLQMKDIRKLISEILATFPQKTAECLQLPQLHKYVSKHFTGLNTGVPYTESRPRHKSAPTTSELVAFVSKPSDLKGIKVEKKSACLNQKQTNASSAVSKELKFFHSLQRSHGSRNVLRSQILYSKQCGIEKLNATPKSAYETDRNAFTSGLSRRLSLNQLLRDFFSPNEPPLNEIKPELNEAVLQKSPEDALHKLIHDNMHKVNKTCISETSVPNANNTLKEKILMFFLKHDMIYVAEDMPKLLTPHIPKKTNMFKPTFLSESILELQNSSHKETEPNSHRGAAESAQSSADKASTNVNTKCIEEKPKSELGETKAKPHVTPAKAERLMVHHGSSEAHLTGLARYFNSVTITGRANVAKATLACVAVGYLYYISKKRTKSRRDEEPPK